MAKLLTQMHQNIDGLCEETAKFIEKNHKLERPEKKATNELKKEVKHDIEKAIQQFSKRIVRGAFAIFDTLAVLAEFSHLKKEIVDKLEEVVKEIEAHEDYQSWIQNALEENKSSFQEMYGLSEEFMNVLYKLAKHLIEHKYFEKAGDAFAFLCLLNPNTYEFWLGLGVADANAEHYEEAITAFGISIVSDPFTPIPHIYAAECYAKLHDKEMALDALHYAQLLISENSEFSQLKADVEAKINMLKKQ